MVSKEYIPKGTRFGPLIGEIYTNDTVPKNANRKYFWRVSKETFLRLLNIGGRWRLKSRVPSFSDCDGGGAGLTQENPGILSKFDETG